MRFYPVIAVGLITSALVGGGNALATPANKAALKRYYGNFLSEELNRCTTCHLPSSKKDPESLAEFPHNRFGEQLRQLGEHAHKPLAERLSALKDLDSDGDGVSNETEIVLGTNPGAAGSTPSSVAISAGKVRIKEFKAFLAEYKWEPFQPVKRPSIPAVANSGWARNELDQFVAVGREKRGLKPRPEASKEALLRRAFMDLIGLNPAPEERQEFLADKRSDAYERLVDRLLDDPRYGERWGRHWMDVWRYSDWAGWSGGNQIRDSKPHIWRWRDWIVESLNKDKPYERMIVEMLAADELAPEDTDALRATGFLVRNYKMLSREQWLEDTVKHTSQAFLGVTIGCAKCHDHRTDPITQDEYYQLRAVFEPHEVRTDRVPGELDTGKNGLVRVYDAGTNRPTFFFVRGDERKPDTNRVMKPGVPRALANGGVDFLCEPVALPKAAAFPDRRKFVIDEVLAASLKSVQEARTILDKPGAAKQAELELSAASAEMKHEILLKLIQLEELQEQGADKSDECKRLAAVVAGLQKQSAVLEAKLKLAQAQRGESEAASKKKDADGARRRREEAEQALVEKQKQLEKSWGTDFTPRPAETYPLQSTGRRLAFARWVASERNPLTARVAMNHIWLRHFGRGLVTTPENFGASGNLPSNPELLDWLASEFMSRGWSMKTMHRLILTSATYRMASTPDEDNLRMDPDNIYLWRMPSRRLDAELVRDNLLHVAGDLDGAMGGPDIDHNAGLTSKRRSVYLRIAAEKEVEFLKIFDGPAVTECYQRHATVMPQQALAMGNSKIALAQARSLAQKLANLKEDSLFVERAFERVLARMPTEEEKQTCQVFLSKNGDKSRENLALVLFNHNDFVTVR